MAGIEVTMKSTDYTGLLPRSPDYTTASNEAVGDPNGGVTVTVNGTGNCLTTTGNNYGCNGSDANIFNFQTDGNTLTVERRSVRRLSPIPPTAQFPTVIEEPATPCYEDTDAAIVNGGGGKRKDDKEMNGCAGVDMYKQQQQQQQCPRRRLPSINANMVKNMPSRSFDSGT